MQWLGGVAGGAALGNTVDKGVDKVQESLPHVLSDWELFLESFPLEWKALREDIKRIAQNNKPSAQVTVNLMANGGYHISRQGHEHVSLLTSASFQILVRPTGLGYFTLTVQPGWNVLDFPEGTLLELPQGTSGLQTVVLLYADYSIGNAI